MSVLSHHDEFQKILNSYRVSESGKKLLEETMLVLLLAPSSTGRNTIIKHLLKTGRYHYIISDTTREPRINDGVPERTGREYWFKTAEEFLTGIKQGEYLEAAL